MGELIYTVGGDSNLVSCKSAAKVPFDSLKVEFAPVQSGSGDPSPSNVRPISGWTGIELYQNNNLFMPRNATTIATNNIQYIQNNFTVKIQGTAYIEGKEDGYGSGYVVMPWVCQNKIVYLSNMPVYNNIKWFIYDGTTNTTLTQAVNDINNIPIQCIIGHTFFLCSYTYIGQTYDLTITPMLSTELNQTTLSYPISWQSEIGTIYGGYIDLVTGILTITRILNPFLSIMYSSRNESEGWVQVRFEVDHTNPIAVSNTKMLSDRFNTEIASGKLGRIAWYNNNLYANAPIEQFSGYNSPSVVDWYNTYKPQILLTYITPVTYQLTPLQIKSLLGQNNFWSNTNGNTTASYPLVETGSILEAKKRIYQFMSSGEVLPPQYQKVDYLESTGYNARIDTGVAGNDTALKFIFDAMVIDSAQYNALFGNYNGEDKSCWRIIQYSDSLTTRSFIFTAGNRPAGSSSSAPVIKQGGGVPNTLVHFEMEYGKCTGTSEDFSRTTTATDVSAEMSTRNIAIGSMSSVATGSTVRKRFYHYFKIKRGNILIRNYIPCYRKSDNLAGFYDTVNYTFNPSIGSVNFVAGNDT